MMIILENTNQLEFQTDLSKLIIPFREKFRSLNWLLTDLDFIILDADKYGSVEKLNLEEKAINFNGIELCDLVEKRKIQFVFGVLTGFNTEIPHFAEESLPTADQNQEVWTEPKKFQIPSAEIEIICWDSSTTILKFKDNLLGQKFMQEFPDSKEYKKTSVNPN